MAASAAFVLGTAVILIMVVASAAQQQCLNIGRTVSKYGIGVAGSAESQVGIDFFIHWINTVRGGVRWNGTGFNNCRKDECQFLDSSFFPLIFFLLVKLVTTDDASGLTYLKCLSCDNN